MDYIEVTLNIPENLIDETVESLTALGAEGFVIESESDFKSFLENNRQYWDYVDEELEKSYSGASRIKFYLCDDASGNAILSAVKSAYPGIQTAICRNEDWENNWKQYYEPIPIGDRLLVVPEWLDASEEGRVNLRLDPGLTFGTGSHPTTAMCLAGVQNYRTEGARVLDLGCGSGILGIGAILLGAAECVSADIDPKSADVVLSNAALNGIGGDKIRVYIGDVTCDKALNRNIGTDYDIVFANIVSDVIIPLSAHVRQFMAENAVFITSGIIEGRQDEVKAALISSGFEIIEHRSKEEWHCFVCR